MEHKNNDSLFFSTIYTKENMDLLQKIPVLNDGQIYIYVILNSHGDIKIGKTTNIQQRLTSLSGSNGGGSKISAVYCSPSTWIQSLEGTCHNYYHFARIPGTEWFDGRKVSFEDVVKHIEELFHSKGYEICNGLREKLNSKEENDDNERN